MLLNYIPLVGDFPVKAAGTGNLGAYVNTVVTFVIGMAGILAVIMIIIGGVQYVSTDSWSGKDDGKKRIQAALGGLVLALCCYLILNTIDPNLTNVNFTVKPVEDLEMSGGNIIIVDPSEYDTHESSFYDPSNPYTGIEDDVAINPIQDGDECASLAQYRARGRVPVKDNSGNPGTISPEIAWLVAIVPEKWPDLHANSTYRSPEHNNKIGGSKNSAHMRGEAVDFFGSGIGKASARELVEWARQDVCRIGIRQVIYQKTGYNIGSGTWTATGHDDHVHIGR